MIDLSDDIEIPSPNRNHTDVADMSIDGGLDDDDEDEDMKRALALSLASSTTYATLAAPATPPSKTVETAVNSTIYAEARYQREQESPKPVVEKAASAPSAFNGMSRAEMERERQERIKKRSLSASGQPVDQEMNGHFQNGAFKRRTLEIPMLSPPVPAFASLSPISPPVLSSPASSSSSASTSASASASASASPLTRALATTRNEVSINAEPYIKQEPPTKAKQSVKMESTVKIEPDVKMEPIMSTGSSSLLYSQIPGGTSASAKSPPALSHSFASESADYPPQYMTASFRNTHIQGTMPGKWTVRFQDLVNKDYLQKAVLTTFNLGGEDDQIWREKHLPPSITQLVVTHWSKNDDRVQHDWEQLVNTVYIQDFFYMPTAFTSPEDMGDFGSTLHNFLKVMTVPEKVLSVVRTIDLRPAKVLLVPAVQGSFPVASEHTYGIAQLAKVMQSKCSKDQEWEIEYQTSSLGKLSARFLIEIHRASQGLRPRARTRLNEDERVPQIKVVFPTEKHVQNSRLGELGAGTVCFQEAYWEEATFPRRVMHDFECVGANRGSLMHSKIILGKAVESDNALRRSESGSGSNSAAGWIYVGSANFTESAWGSVTLKKPIRRPAAPLTSTGTLSISMRNWELGVIYVIETEEEMEAMANVSWTQNGRSQDEQPFFGPLPVPYKRPLTPYKSTDRPWFGYR
ncbi:hypothetical protein BGZ50_006059 [Haplosporangium sp. Z 11]|nr:hypothetical protein BGZ50_006059 [Haplosporangium sp. Z 11]